jgi:hypothetical protein
VRLSLPSAPNYSNGSWNQALKEVVWKSDIEGRTNESHFPFFCYASWVRPGQKYQEEHFGKVALTGDGLLGYCLWRGGLDKSGGAQWDDFVASLRPGGELVKRVNASRLQGEPNQTPTNTASSSSYPRDLLKSVLE